MHCIKCQKYRNEVCCNAEMQRERALMQKENIKRQVEEREPKQVRMFARRLKVDMNKCEIETIFEQIKNVQKMAKKVKSMQKNDVRCHF